MRLRRICNNPGQRRFSGARRPVEDGRSQPVCLNRPVQQRPGAEQLLLPHELLQRLGPHPISQRSPTPGLRLRIVFKQIHSRTLLFSLTFFRPPAADRKTGLAASLFPDG